MYDNIREVVTWVGYTPFTFFTPYPCHPTSIHHLYILSHEALAHPCLRL